MKRLFLAVIAIVLAGNVFGQLDQQVQRFCGSQLDLMEMQRTDPRRYQQFMDYEDLLQNQLLNSKSIPTGVMTIPVVVHVVYNTSAQNISDARINEQIQVLNEDFRRLNADRVNTPSAFASVAGDAQIEFKLAKTDPNGNVTTGITRTSTTVTGFSQPLNNVKTTSTGGHDPWDTQRYLNIWVCNLTSPSNLMGYSTFPVDFVTSPNLDGVVINFIYFGKTGTSSPGNKGRTATHEVGHWLDLRHIWGDNPACTTAADDGVSDTPLQSTANTGCPTFPKLTDACTKTTPGVMFMNYMDCTDDGCMNLFTKGQIARMRALFDTQIGIRRNIAISAVTGPDEICPTGIYSLDSGHSAVWSVSTGFTITPANNGTSATVKATSSTLSNGGTGTVTAVVNGVTVTKTIQACVRTITGPSTICPSGTYSLNTGESPIWGVSGGNFNVSSVGSSLTTTVTALSSNSSGWVTAYYDGKTVIYPIVSCSNLPPPLPVIQGPDYVSSCANATAFTLSSGQATSWSVNPPYEFTIVSSNATSASIKVNNPSSNGVLGVIVAVLSGSGGISKPFTTKSCSSSVMAFPNPASDILNIEFDQEVIEQAKSIEQTNFRSITQDATYEIRLYDRYGILLRQAQTRGEKVEFNVTNLSNGMYFLHIYNGINERPEMRKIIIQH